jgi:hypothetical protein
MEHISAADTSVSTDVEEISVLAAADAAVSLHAVAATEAAVATETDAAVATVEVTATETDAAEEAGLAEET